MLDWIKLETSLLDDPRIQALIDECQMSGLGIYAMLRLHIDAQEGRGLPLDYLLTLGGKLARRKRFLHIIRDFGLFAEDEFGMVHACALTPACGSPACASPAPACPAQTLNITSNEKNGIGELEKDIIVVRKRFVKPSVEEIRAYCLERHNAIDAEMFFDFYEAKGWKVGGSPMKDWRAAVRTWERRGSGGRAAPDLPRAETQSPQREVASQLIPEDAPPRPSPTAQWDFATDSWTEFY